MATLDFTPLHRSTVGFDHLSNLLSHALDREGSTYPPYNIERIDDEPTASSWRWLVSPVETLRS